MEYDSFLTGLTWPNICIEGPVFIGIRQFLTVALTFGKEAYSCGFQQWIGIPEQLID